MRFIPAALMILAAAAPAQAGWVYFAGDPQGNSTGCVTAAPPTTVDLYVIADPTYSGLLGVSFRVSGPGRPGMFLVAEDVMSGLFLGDAESGIEIATGSCVSGPIAVLRLQYYVTGIECGEVVLLPHPGASSGEVEIVDCAAQTRTCRVMPAFVTTGSTDCNYSPPPQAVSPLAGATGVPLSSVLRWEFDGPHMCSPLPLGISWSNVYFGTEPSPPLVAEFTDPPYDPGPLVPGTTYYWKIDVMNFGYWGRGPVWSFTTENATPAESKTWGAVKALYR